jgi:hypothetical protein
MDRVKFARWMTNFYRTAWDNTMVMLKQCRQGAPDLSKVSPWMREGSRKFINEWTKSYKKGYNDFREATGEHYRKYEALFGLQKRPDSADAVKDKNLN